MSKIKVDTTGFLDLQDKMQNVVESISNIREFWGDNFDDMYQAFFGDSDASSTIGASHGEASTFYDNKSTTGRGYDALDKNSFMYQLYSKSESNWYEFFEGFEAAGATASVVALACAATPVGWVIAALTLIGSIFGIVVAYANKDKVKFHYDSRDVFQLLLAKCMYGDDDNFRKISNINSKIDSIYLSLIEIMNKINDYQMEYADFSDSASKLNLKYSTANDDGITLTSIDTNVNIDGETVSLSTSEAINAFFTYENTVMSAEFEATVLEQQGIKVNYEDIVKNANGFMKNSINSRLYSKEFVNVVLPSYNGKYSYDGAINSVTDTNGLSTETFKSVLSKVPGVIGSSAGLIGGAFLGSLVSNSPIRNTNSTGVNTGSNNISGGNSQNSSEVIGVIDNVNPTNTPSKVDEILNSVDIPEKISDVIPDNVDISDVNIDYDELARSEYESKGSDAIDKYREEIVNAVNSKYDEGDFESIKAKLKEYGYSDVDIENIIKDRQATLTAIIAGDEQQELSKIAKDLANKDGITDYKSLYDESNTYKDTVDGTLNTILVNMSDNKDLVSAREEVTKSYDIYKEKVNIANDYIAATAAAEVVMNKTMEDFSKQYNTDDTTKWDESAAREYADLVTKYNDSLTKTNDAVKASEKAKKSYEDAGSKYNDIKKEFLNNIRKENDRTSSVNNVDDNDNSINYNPILPSENDEYDDSSENINSSKDSNSGNISSDLDSSDSNIPSDGVSSSNSISISDDDLLNLIHPSEDNTSINF